MESCRGGVVDVRWEMESCRGGMENRVMLM